jgi:CRISPR system Cascade subunit CasA
VLQNISDKDAFDLWVGALVTNQAKPVDTMESVFHVPAAMLTETSQMVYEKGVRLAETTESRMKRAVSAYHKELGDNLDRPEMKSRRQQVQSNAAAQFWTDIERAVPRLIEVAAAPKSLGPKSEWHKTPWGQSVWRAARAAYERACPHETPRQIRAYALGLRTLFVAPVEQAEVEEEKKAEA